MASSIDHLTASGVLATSAGTIARVEAEEPGGAPDRLRVDWRPRAGGATRRLIADLVVNCTGPNGDLAASGDALVSTLSRTGAIRADACGIGVDVDPDGRLIGADGVAAPSLFAVGPITRGAFWEVTAVPDIRVQAARMAGVVLSSLHKAAPCPA